MEGERFYDCAIVYFSKFPPRSDILIFIMNRHNQKPTDMFNKQDVTAYLTYIKILKENVKIVKIVASCLLNMSLGFWLCLFIIKLYSQKYIFKYLFLF